MIRLTPLALILLVTLVLVAIAGLVLVPAGTGLPVHWGLSGAADAYLAKEWALAMPVALAACLWAGALIFSRLAPEHTAAGRHVLGATLTAMTALALTIESALVLIGIGIAVDMVQVLVASLGVLFMVLGNALPKSRPNGLAGLRIPSTLNDAANWQATHRLAGWLTMAGGAVLIVAALVVPAPLLVWWVVACIGLPLLAGTVYSLVLARRSVRA